MNQEQEVTMEYLKTTTFKNKEFGSVRMVDDNGRLLFCGADVALSLIHICSGRIKGGLIAWRM